MVETNGHGLEMWKAQKISLVYYVTMTELFLTDMWHLCESDVLAIVAEVPEHQSSSNRKSYILHFQDLRLFCILNNYFNCCIFK